MGSAVPKLSVAGGQRDGPPGGNPVLCTSGAAGLSPPGTQRLFTLPAPCGLEDQHAGTYREQERAGPSRGSPGHVLSTPTLTGVSNSSQAPPGVPLAV